MIQPNKIKTILAGLRSCNYADKPIPEQLAFIIGYLAGAGAAAGQVRRLETPRLDAWGKKRFEESQVLLKFIKKEQEIVEKQTAGHTRN